MNLYRYNRAREFAQLLRNLPSFTAGQARVTTYDDEFLDWLDVEIRPSDGVYNGATFVFKVGTHFEEG